MREFLARFLESLLRLLRVRPHGGGTPRSGRWRSLRNRWLAAHPECAFCGGAEGLTPHHVVPVDVDPSRELDEANLISLCEGRTCNCHLHHGHLGRWDAWNPWVAEEAALYRARRAESRRLLEEHRRRDG